jgi:hypothetical protein
VRKIQEHEAKKNNAARILALLAQKSVHAYFLLWKNGIKQQKLNEMKNDRDSKTLKLMALLGKPKPYVYFLLWKNDAIKQKVDDLRK